MKDILQKRNIPDVLENVNSVSDWDKRREYIKDLLQKEEYGFIPQKPDRLEFSEEIIVKNFGAGKTDLKKITITSYIGDKMFSFPAYSTVPKDRESLPAFIHINFRDDVPDRYMPNEEIIDNGFAVFSFCYKDVTSDSNDFTDGLAGVLFENGERCDTDPGKIAMWAWAAMRVMDYVETITCVDKNKVSVCGHSRLGKTALLTGAFDDRFACAFSNDSGCSGAAIARGNTGENIYDICQKFPYWFCKNYYKYQNNEDKLPFDQHYLISLIAPRYAYVASAEKDAWADPKSEQLSCLAASAVWNLYEKKGLMCNDAFAQCNDYFHDGCIGYHLRGGTHYFSRDDWNYYIKFLKSKMF
ncbi:MAG: hypothetical protein E7404_07890 [Ruminococcaceae bacterium]|nr:hypothetical protein [Oscillospiraceae bacterium]